MNPEERSSTRLPSVRSVLPFRGNPQPPSGAMTGNEALTQVLRLDGTDWRVGIDPRNAGREAKWYQAPLKDALPATVPGVIQSAFPAYHGAAWYWHEFAAVNPHAEGRYWLRFRAVNYVAEVWLKGVKPGAHEGAQEPFCWMPPLPSGQAEPIPSPCV
jgi:hypothetical protein